MVILQINIMDTNENLLNDAYNSIIDQIYKYCDRLIEQKMINRFDFMNKNVPALTQLYNELTHDISITDYMILTSYFMNLFRIIRLNGLLKRHYHITRKRRRDIVQLIRKRAALIRKKNYLVASHKLLHYWHVVHVPLAIVMFLIMFIHIAVYYLFRPDIASVL